MRRLRDWLQHHCNELHLCCRLKDFGFSEATAKRVSVAIGNTLKPFIYRGSDNG